MAAVDYVSAINTKGSGLNITQIVESLVEAETKPKVDLINKKIDGKNLDISALGQIKSELSNLNASLISLTNVSKFKTASGNVNTSLNVVDSSKANVFSSDINISSLATPQTLEFSGFALPTSTTGSGVITIDFGNWIASDGTATDTDSLFASGTTVSASTSLGTPISHNSLGGQVTISTSAGGNQSSTSFTIIGKDMAGNNVTEVVTGGGDGQTVSSINVFKSITSITPGSTVGTGTVTVGHSANTFGKNTAKTSKTVTITQGSSIETIANNLNQISGVTASVLNKGDGTYSLVLRSDTGRNSALRLTVSENSGDTGLSVLDTTSDNNSHQTTSASDAELTVDGVSINRSSNTVTDIFEGYSLSISATTSSSFRVSSSLDEDTSLENMKTFVSAFNQTRSLFEELTKSSDLEENRGPLSDDVMIGVIKNQLNNLVNSKLNGFGSNDYYASSLGLQTARDGSLSVDEAKFKKNFLADPNAFNAIFISSFSSNSAFLSVTSDTTIKPKPGQYSFIFDSGNSTATLDGLGMTSGTDDNGNTFYASTTGDATGIKITPSQTVDSAFIFYGESLVEKLSKYTNKLLEVSGDLANKEIEFNQDISDFNLELTDLDTVSENLEKRYKKQFTAMEGAISSLKNTGEFMTNLMESFNKD